MWQRALVSVLIFVLAATTLAGCGRKPKRAGTLQVPLPGQDEIFEELERQRELIDQMPPEEVGAPEEPDV